MEFLVEIGESAGIRPGTIHAHSSSASVVTGLRPVWTGQRPVTTHVATKQRLYRAEEAAAGTPYTLERVTLGSDA